MQNTKQPASMTRGNSNAINAADMMMMEVSLICTFPVKGTERLAFLGQDTQRGTRTIDSSSDLFLYSLHMITLHTH